MWLLALLLAAEEPFFVQSTNLNLREKPDAKANIALVVGIGETCVVLEDAGSGWSRMRCKDAEGYAKTELLGKEKPEVAPNLAKAKDTNLTTAERLNFALRAASLDLKNKEALELVRTLFFESELGTLEASQAHPKKKANKGHAGPVCPPNKVDCRDRYMAFNSDEVKYPEGATGYMNAKWKRHALRGENWVLVYMHENWPDLVVVSGHFEPGRVIVDNSCPSGCYHFRVFEELRYKTSTPLPALVRALERQ